MALAVALCALALRIAEPSALAQLRNLAFDEYQRLAPRPFDPDLPVKIVAIDEAALAALGQWPWPRRVLGELVDRLNAAGAAAIALDFALAEPDRSDPRAALATLPDSADRDRLLQALPPADAGDLSLAKALSNLPSVLGLILTHGEKHGEVPHKAGFASAGDDPRPFLPAFESVTAPLPPLAEAASGLGAMNWLPDRDQIVRTVPLLFLVDGKVVPSLAAEALRTAQGASTLVARASNASGQTAFGAASGINAVKIGAVVIPTDAAGAVRVHFSETDPSRLLSAGDVHTGDFDPAEVAGKIVLLGATAPGLLDLRATPLEAAVPGVEIHAQLLEHILSGATLKRPDWASGLEILAFAGLAILIAVAAGLLPVRWSFGLGVVAIAGWVAASWLAFSRAGLLVDPTFPALGTASVLFATTGYVGIREERDRRQIRSAFGRYVAPGLVEELARDPDRLRLGGEIKEMTILFTDMRGFTTVSEGMDAERLTAFVNAFLTPLTDAVLTHRGTIDKYIGDAVMAFWNAPLDDDDHARHGCEAALAMLQAIEAFNAGDHTYPKVAIGIGLNTGLCCVGNLGSVRRFDYSVIGDDVNIASRLEGQTKSYGVSIIVGEATAHAVPDFALIEFDRVRVKGKTRPISLFALMGGAERAADASFQALKAAMDRFVAAYRAGHFVEAAKTLSAVEAADNGGLATIIALYRERLLIHGEGPAPDGWSGVHDLLTK
ncbi:CHASE2 domain-containing protein [Amorphus sp. 3PC139-8]|uniref:CHASE2 domain-containing protein n=1 Tax=Amorphus sp. 3PC139-8 TaxID=2735676 RepID=UPI00345E041B